MSLIRTSAESFRGAHNCADYNPHNSISRYIDCGVRVTDQANLFRNGKVAYKFGSELEKCTASGTPSFDAGLFKKASESVCVQSRDRAIYSF